MTRPLTGSKDPQYMLATTDIVAIVAVMAAGKLILVPQYRTVTGKMTLEIPSGHVEAGETPEEAARKELLEETGRVADNFELLLTVGPCIGRYTNQLWSYFAANARPTDDSGYKIEDGIKTEFYGGSVKDLVFDQDLRSSFSHSALLAALARGKLSL